MEDILPLLKFLDGIFPLSENLKNHLTQIVKVRQLPKKKYLLKAGHVSNQVYVIEKGLLRCFQVNEREEVCTWFMKEWDVVFSVSSFYDQKESNEYIEALEDCTLYYISHGELMSIYKNYLEFNFVGRVITERYHKFWVNYTDAMRRRNAHERYRWLFDNFPELMLRVPSRYLSTFLNMNEVTLSKIKSKSAKKKDDRLH